MQQSDQDQLMEKLSIHFSKAFKIAMEAVRNQISAEIKKEVKAALASPPNTKAILQKPKNYDKFKLLYLETDKQKILNKRMLAKAVYDQLVSLNPHGYTLQELREILPTDKRTFLEVSEVVRKNNTKRYFMDSPYLTSDQKEIVFYNQWSIDTIMQLQQHVANNETSFKLKIEKAG